MYVYNCTYVMVTRPAQCKPLQGISWFHNSKSSKTCHRMFLFVHVPRVFKILALYNTIIILSENSDCKEEYLNKIRNSLRLYVGLYINEIQDGGAQAVPVHFGYSLRPILVEHQTSFQWLVPYTWMILTRRSLQKKFIRSVCLSVYLLSPEIVRLCRDLSQ